MSTMNRKSKYVSGSLGLALCCIGLAACSNDQAAFRSGNPSLLELARDTDGVTSTAAADAVYTTAQTEPSIDFDAIPDEEAPPKDVAAVLESKPADPANSNQYDVSGLISSQPTTGEKPATEDTSAEGKSKKDGRPGEGPQGGAANGARPEQGVAGSDKERDAKAAAAGCGLPAIDDATLNTCRSALDLPKELTKGEFKNVSVIGKNLNNRTIFSDKGTETKPTYLNICAKNVNSSTVELLDPKGVYCIDMRVKNMNTFQFKFHCDAKVAFVNLKRKNANNEETLKLQCKN